MPHCLPDSGTVLHVGCGSLRIEATPFGALGWEEIRLDIDPAVSPDLIGTITSMPEVPTASVDAVFLPKTSSISKPMRYPSLWPSSEECCDHPESF
jgi:hypothetical protein